MARPLTRGAPRELDVARCAPHGPERRAAELAAARIDAINLRQQYWTGGLTTLFHRFDVLCFGWDAQHERQIARLIDMGIDAVYSDFVDRMVAVAATFAGDSRPAVGDDGD